MMFTRALGILLAVFVAGCGDDVGAPAADQEAAGNKVGRGRGKRSGAALDKPGADVIPAELSAGDGHARMVARLAVMADQADPEEDIYLNEERVEMYRERLERASETGEPRMPIRLMLGTELVLAGHPREAAEEIQDVLAKIVNKDAVNPEFIERAQQMLAQAWLRVGEQGNCIEHHGSQSCLLPIEEGGIHADPTGSREATRVLLEILGEDSQDFAARWLLNIAAMTLGNWPAGVPPEFLVPPEAFASEQEVGRFADVARECGITERGLAGGVCMEDFDADGLLDLVISEWSLRGPLRYYRGTPDGRFVERGKEAGFDGLTGGLNLLHADYDNDGDADVLVLRGAWRAEFGARYPLSLLQNDGLGVFRDVTEDAGLLCFLSTQTAAWGDYDGDGWLDLFVGNESVGKNRGPCRLYRSDRDGTFTEVAEQVGLDVVGYVKGSGFGDYDDDGRIDLFVSRMDGDKWLFHNEGERFVEVGKSAGVTEPETSFPCWWFDFDQDGRIDLFVSGYRFGQTQNVAKDYLGLPHEGVTPRLYRNSGDGTFEDVTEARGLLRVLPAMGCNWGDLDNDGWPDFYLATGEPDYRAIYPNRLFRNDEGRRFLDVTTSAGMGHLQKGHGVAFGDLDRDGDQDVFAVMGGAYSGDVFQRVLFENPGHGNHWVTLVLEGTKANRCAIGARVGVRVRRPDGSTREVHHLVGTGGSFGSETLQAEIGLGDAVAIEEVVIRWPGSGTVQSVKDVALDRTWRVREGDAAPVALERPRFRLGGVR